MLDKDAAVGLDKCPITGIKITDVHENMELKGVIEQTKAVIQNQQNVEQCCNNMLERVLEEKRVADEQEKEENEKL